MKNCFLTIVILLFCVAVAFGEETFLLKEASKNFDVKIKVEKCEDDICEGKGTVYLLKKGSPRAFQIIQMPDIHLELGENRKPTANLIELYGMNNSGVVFDDFNFDGLEDIALRNGNNGSYGGPSYDIFVYSKQKGKFFKNSALTELASNNLGLFVTNKKTKTIETFDKSGCCWHQTTRYRFINGRLQKIYILTEDASRTENDWVIITTERLVNGKWRKTTRRVPMK